MVDFLKISTKSPKQGIIEVFPKFRVGNSKDLMIRGGDFYAIWLEDRGLWSTNEQDVIDMIDDELRKYAEKNTSKFEGTVRILYMWDSDSGMIDKWHKYCQKQSRDSFHMLDETILFANSKTDKKNYASKRLNYPLEKGDHPSWDMLVSTLYSEEERHKIEWAIGAIVTGDSKKIQKFLVFYGAAGTGKSTILNIIQMLFDGYYSVFDAKALGSSTNVFALEAFKTNPLVAIQHDGDLSKIEDNTRLNSLVSHELMTVNEKFKSTYSSQFKCFLLMGTNKPVRITDGKSGIIRRLIDVTPTGNKVPTKKYNKAMEQIKFELGAIAYHCKEVYLSDPGIYDTYVPVNMMGATNDFYNFVIDSYSTFLKEDGTTLKAAWEMYKNYCEDAKVSYPYSKRNFKEELKNYFETFEERFSTNEGTRVRSYYSGFKTDIFETEKKPEEKNGKTKLEWIAESWIKLREGPSIFDDECKNCPAQLATAKETPTKAWDNVTTTLEAINTKRLHYVKVPENHIVIDFDIKDSDGNKNLELNLEAASLWPPTYAELSKGGGGLHLHYIYNGDVNELSRLYDTDIEVKVYTGKSSLRRKLTQCNDLPIATISSGLPLKEKKMINKDVVQNENGLRTTIKKCLAKEVHSGTKSNVDFIYKILNDAYKSGVHYDVSDLRNDVFIFAGNSTHNAEYCMKLVKEMPFKSEDAAEAVNNNDAPIVFYDVEVFPNLFLVNWKEQGEGKPVVRMINPSPSDIEDLLRYRLVGFNCRRYDNHIMYGRLIGYSNEDLYKLSQKIITAQKGDRNNGLFGEAYNLSYTDVYDFAAKKQSLKKWEIELGIHHQELGLPWDKPVPEELWTKVAEYCDNDVIATEAVFNHLEADFLARQILAKLANGTENDTTNSLTTKIIFGRERKPQWQFNYRNLAEPVSPDRYEEYSNKPGFEDYDFRIFDNNGQPIYESFKPGMVLPEGYSIMPFFPGYKYDHGKSTYRGEEVGEGGYVYAEPGMYGDTALLDIASMHPHSEKAEKCFGEYNKNFEDIINARIYIKHGDFDKARTMLGGRLAEFLEDESIAGMLAQALKIAINSVYGLTAATFENPFRDPRNVDNIIAKRGALFMVNLKHEVQKRGFTVAHIKTDSIKIPDATPEIIKFVCDYGREYGYTFEHEATYEKMCLVNDAVYIAKYKGGSHDGEWTATGKQFQVPYVFKTLFSKEKIEFSDMCETFSVSKGDLYLDYNESLPDVSYLEKQLEKENKDFKAGKITEGQLKEATDILSEEISAGHDLRFIGRVGSFCPILPGHGAGVLYRVNDGKNYAAPGSKGYRWLEAEMVRGANEEFIDRSFYNNLVDDAVETISKYGDFEWFISDDPYVKDFMYIPDGAPEETPFVA